VTFRSLLAVPHFGLFVAMIFSLQMVDRSFGPVLPLYLREIGTPPAQVPVVAGLVFTVAAGAAAVGNYLCARLMRQIPPASSWEPPVLPRWRVGLQHRAASSLLMAAAVIFGLESASRSPDYTVAGQRVRRVLAVWHSV
jgi:MFS family permease